MSNALKVDFIVGIVFIIFVLCVIITYHQMFSDNVTSVRFVLFAISRETGKDKWVAPSSSISEIHQIHLSDSDKSKIAVAQI